MIFIRDYGSRLLWALVPLTWGIITWFLAWDAGAQLPLSYPNRLLIALVVLIIYFYKTLEYARRHNTMIVFNYSIRLPSWKLLCGSAMGFLAIYSLFFKWDTHPIFQSFVFIVFAFPCLEELLTHSFFIKYRMSLKEFLVFNTISALAFTLMHGGYTQDIPALSDLLSRGHLLFGFIMGVIAYRTQRIEVPILLHMGSNFFNCTLPTLILHRSVPVLSLMFFSAEIALCLIAKHKFKNDYNKKGCKC